MTLFFLLASIFFSWARNTLSKSISTLSFGTKQFFQAQAVIFLSGSLLLLLISGIAIKSLSGLTLLYAILYGILLLSAQYCYTVALKRGKVGICSTVYSFGFIFPTLSGCLFWNETLTLWNGIGLIFVIPTILLSSSASNDEHQKQTESFLLPLLIAMLSSGGLGILQKTQQTSPYPDEKNIFIILAFAIAGIVSLFFSFFAKKNMAEPIKMKKLYWASGIGISFGCSNLLNTMLAGLLPVSVFSPVLNTSTILLSIISGIVLFHEKLTSKDCLVLVIGLISILLITMA